MTAKKKTMITLMLKKKVNQPANEIFFAFKNNKLVFYCDCREFEPVKFKILANKYDPHGIYRKKYLDIQPENNSLTNEQETIDSNRLKKRLVKRHSITT